MALVLVVDDEPDVRLLARVVLSSAGHDVAECSDGASAIVRLAQLPRPDVVLLDVRMPGLTGWDVLDRLGADAPPVLLLTADSAALERDGHDHVLAKPYRPHELLAAVDKLLGGTAP